MWPRYKSPPTVIWKFGYFNWSVLQSPDSPFEHGNPEYGGSFFKYYIHSRTNTPNLISKLLDSWYRGSSFQGTHSHSCSALVPTWLEPWEKSGKCRPLTRRKRTIVGRTLSCGLLTSVSQTLVTRAMWPELIWLVLDLLFLRPQISLIIFTLLPYFEEDIRW